MINFMVLGVIPSKSNSYQWGNGTFFKKKVVYSYEDSFKVQTTRVPKEEFKKGDRLFVIYEFYVRNMNQDVDNMEKSVNDCLEACDIIPNDNQIIIHQSTKISDKKNPRVKISISLIGGDNDK